MYLNKLNEYLSHLPRLYSSQAQTLSVCVIKGRQTNPSSPRKYRVQVEKYILKFSLLYTSVCVHYIYFSPGRLPGRGK